MNVNLVKQVTDLFDAGHTSAIAGSLGEPENNVSKGISAVVPAIFSSLISYAHTPGSSLTAFMDRFSGSEDTDLVNSITQLGGSPEEGHSGLSSILNDLFGDKLSAWTSGIAQFSGLKQTSVASVLGLAVPYVVNFVKKYFAANGYNTEPQMITLLEEQRQYVSAALPPGAGLSHLYGFSTPDPDPLTVVPPDYNPVEKPGNRGKGWLWLLILVILALLVWWLMGREGCDNKSVDTGRSGAVTHTDSLKEDTSVRNKNVQNKLDEFGNYIYEVGDETTIRLADGTEMRVGDKSTEMKLYTFLSDNKTQVSDDKTVGWITLDRVYFETGKNVLTAQSQEQIKNIAAILKNFPKAKVKLGGYTDNTGSDDINMPLSAQRAKIAADKLAEAGAGAANIQSEGYGSQHPVCAANDTDECKAQNRRVDIRVQSK